MANLQAAEKAMSLTSSKNEQMFFCTHQRQTTCIAKPTSERCVLALAGDDEKIPPQIRSDLGDT